MKISKLISLALTVAAVAIVAAPAGAATFAGTKGADNLRGTVKADVIRGKAGADTIRGRKGNDRLYGQKGADTLVGGPGFDRMFGGAGDDTINAEDGARDTVVCGPGIDAVRADPMDSLANDCETGGLSDPGVDFPTGDHATPGDPGPGVPPSTDGNGDLEAPTEDPADPTPSFPLAVTVTGGGDGLLSQVISDPFGVECRGDCSEEYAAGTEVTLTALAADFLRWEGACSGTGRDCIVTMDAAKSVTAYFDDPRTWLIVEVQGNGAVTGSLPCGVLVSPCSAEFYLGEVIMLRALGREPFLAWGGGCSGTEPTCTLTLTEKTSVTASFGSRPLPEFPGFPFGP